MSRHAINPPFFATSTADIKRVCGYISDDQTVANYFGIDRAKVESVRADIRAPKSQRFNPSPSVYRNSSFGYTSHVAEEEAAAMGSRRLNDALQQMFRRWEREHGFQYGAAERLLPAGYVA